MAKKRYINTRFWSDNYVVNLKPIHRYVFLYLLTNEHTNISGVYELPKRIMSFELDIDETDLDKILSGLQEKIIYIDGWVFVKNFVRHQIVNENVRKGIYSLLNSIPKSLWPKVSEKDIDYIYSIDTLLKSSNYRDLKSLIFNRDSKSLMSSDEDCGQDVDKTDIQFVVDHFYTLRGWDYKNPKYKKIYARFTKPAKELLQLTDGNIEEAKRKITVIKEWAESRKLDWSIETVFKKWFDIPELKPREKKPYFEGQPLFKDHTGKWKIITHSGEVKIFNQPESDISYE